MAVLVSFADLITCPYCKHQDRDMCDYPWHSLRQDEDETSWDCPKCGKSFDVMLHITYEFSSKQKGEKW